MPHNDPNFDISYAQTRRDTLTYDWNGNSNMVQDGRHFTDHQVAGKVRMLMRDDLNHEAICCMARDRIMALSKETHRLRTLLIAHRIDPDLTNAKNSENTALLDQ